MWLVKRKSGDGTKLARRERREVDVVLTGLRRQVDVSKVSKDNC